MSAATMLACACDEIIMAKHSAIGPIDPQMNVTVSGNRYFIPAQSIIDEFRQAKKEVITNPALATLWINKINQYPFGFFKQCKDLVDRSKIIVGKWLNSYMFRSTNQDEKIGDQIANWLGDAKEHKSHGRPLTIEILKEKFKDIKVTALENDQTFQDLVLSVFHACMVTFDITTCVKLIENQNGKGRFSMLAIQQK